MVVRFRAADVVSWALPLRVSLVAVLLGPFSFLLWIHLALRADPRWLWGPLGSFFVVGGIWNYLWLLRMWRRSRDAHRIRLARDVMES